MDKLKASKYNFSFDIENGNILLYNALAGTLAKINHKKVEKTKEILISPDNCKLSEPGEIELLADLKKGKFIIPVDFDEVEWLKIQNRMSKFNSSILHLTIAPTFDCNFRCIYCFETLKKVYMTPEVTQSIINFVKKSIDERGVRYINVFWYGGEPLLCKKTIYELSEVFKTVNYKASLCTNGYLFDKEFIEKLPTLGIEKIYFTLDGPREIHNKRRFLKGQKPTYDVIKNNIEKTIQKWDNKIDGIVKSHKAL